MTVNKHYERETKPCKHESQIKFKVETKRFALI